ncbi:MAG: hypothetical protein H0T42_03765 [Deltaproteobacteria bacterium]|nr:hypothetical protein [Deltaproteobacteria bacterium]
MRHGLVVVVCALAACETNNGTYFVVDGDAAGIAFDQLEFFLGKDTSGPTLYTPARPYTVAISPQELERQRLVKRLFTATDVQTTSETRSLTYYLPPDDENTYAHYALVVASRAGTVVGLGEVEDFSVFDDAAYLYDVPLAAVDAGYERWGDTGSTERACVRWTRLRDGDARMSTYAVIRSGDYDCDDTEADDECDDLSYCDRSSSNGNVCTPRITACINADGCNVGRCFDAVPESDLPLRCESKVCLPDSFCAADDDCREDGSVEDFLKCAVGKDSLHTEVRMPVRAGGPLCQHTFTVPTPLGMACVTPQILWPPRGVVADGWSFDVSMSSSSDGCQYKLTGPSLDATPPPPSHLVVSIVTTTGFTTTFVIGFAAETSGGGDCNDTVRVDLPQGAPKPSCP